jgi:hypothetical protein
MIYSHSFSRFENSQIEIMQELLELLLVQKKRNISSPIEEMFIHVNTVSWVVEGFFYPALVTLFTCFESLLHKQHREQIADLLHLTVGTPEYELFSDLQKFRNGIAHNESHNICRVGANYVCTKIKNNGVDLTTPIITNFDIEKLDKVRIRLIDDIIAKIRA